MHLHLAPWYTNASTLLSELDASDVARGVLYAVYPAVDFGGPDPNEQVSGIALDSNKRVVGFASLNTTGDWTDDQFRDTELGRLSQSLAQDEFVGAKLAPPHTCLELDGDIMMDVTATVAASPSRVLAIHVGTTPFCGPLGEAVGIRTCCQREYVDPTLLEPLFSAYSNVTFILLHSGFDFLPPGDALNYNGSLVDAAIAMALSHPNVFLEISALHAQDMDGTFRYPGGDEVVGRIANAGLASRMMWASDANHVQGTMALNLMSAIDAMVMAGLTDEERCASLSGISRSMFWSEAGTGDDITAATPSMQSPSAAPSTTSGAATVPIFASAVVLLSAGVGLVVGL
jgi:predicted TIM-barrel fold metal-dependent hydrolase